MGCKPKCGYHSLSSIVCFFPIFFAIQIFCCCCLFCFFSRYSEYTIYIANLVSVLLLQSMLIPKHCFIWQTQAHEVLLLRTVYTLKMFLHLRTYSFFLQLPFCTPSLISRTIAPFRFFIIFFFSYWNNAIQKRKKLYLVYVCMYNNIQFLYYFSILSYILWSLQCIKFMLSLSLVADEKMKT